MNLKWLKEDKYLCHIYADISYGIFIDSIICSDFPQNKLISSITCIFLNNAFPTPQQNVCQFQRERGHIALLLSICPLTISINFFEERAHTEMKFGIQIYDMSMQVHVQFCSILGTFNKFSTELCTLNLESFQLYTVSIPFLRRCCTYK